MLYLFSCGARGVMPAPSSPPDVIEVYRHAKAQGVWDTVFLALKRLYDNSQLEIEQQLFNKLKNELMLSSLQQVKRNAFIGETVKALEDNKIDCCILKGEVIAQLYHQPIYRPSTDTDILIPKAMQKKASRILERMGYDVYPAQHNSHHIVAKHPVAGTVELHLDLYDEIFEDVWFDNKILNTEPYRTVSTADQREIKTLGVTDGLIFIALHFIKHFLTKGVGVRQMMDTLLYMAKCREQIDWDRFNSLMKHLKYDKFIENIIGIAVKYCGFPESYFGSYTASEQTMVKILEDMRGGGLFGHGDDTRENFYLIYTKERFATFKDGSYEEYIGKWGQMGTLAALFPNRQVLKIKYPYVQKSALLIPVAWLHRLLNLLLNLLNRKSSVADYKPLSKPESDFVHNRIELIRELDMI